MIQVQSQFCIQMLREGYQKGGRESREGTNQTGQQNCSICRKAKSVSIWVNILFGRRAGWLILRDRATATCGSPVFKRTGSSTEGRTPNIGKLGIVATYSLFKRLSWSFQRNSSCIRKVFNKTQHAFEGFSTKVSLFSLDRKKIRFFWQNITYIGSMYKGFCCGRRKPANPCHPGEGLV